jgi:hypothetical protein
VVSSGNKILATDYNSIQSQVSDVLGTGYTGSVNAGYGQTVTSSQLSVGTKIQAVHFANLAIDLNKIAGHQGTTITLPTITAGNKDLATDTNSFSTASSTLFTNRFNITSGQFSTETLSTATRTTTWGAPATATITHSITVTFASNAHARNFFNAAGKISFTASRTGGAGTTQNTSWTNLLSTMGTINLNYNSTSTTGSGTGSAIGWYQLTTTAQTIFSRYGSAPYAANDYRITAATNVGATQLILTVYFEDLHTNTFSDSVTGTLTSNITWDRPTGTNVLVPTYSSIVVGTAL